MQYLLDTNTCIAVMRNDPLVVPRMSAVTPIACAVSTITAYEPELKSVPIRRASDPK